MFIARFTICILLKDDSAILLHCSNSYKNKEGIDLSKVKNFQRTETDTGSSEAQIARMTARIIQISSHLGQNRKDYAAKRGLELILAERKSLLKYLFRTNR